MKLSTPHYPATQIPLTHAQQTALESLQMDEQTRTGVMRLLEDVAQSAVQQAPTTQRPSSCQPRLGLPASKGSGLSQTADLEWDLAWKLQQALARESELSQLKTRIISVVSHEFRTPLAIINMSAELLANRHEQLTPERRSILHDRLKRSIFNLTDLLQDVVLADSVSRNSLQLEVAYFQFDSFAQRLATHVSQDLDMPANVVFSTQGDPRAGIHVDLHLLRQAVANLVSNALKYSTSEQTILVNTQLQDGFLQVDVIDQGIGILAEDQKYLFDLFYRGQNTETCSGLGLGLYIVAKLVALMGGTITAASAGANRGSTFTLRVPTRVALAESPDDETAAA